MGGNVKRFLRLKFDFPFWGSNALDHSFDLQCSLRVDCRRQIVAIADIIVREVSHSVRVRFQRPLHGGEERRRRIAAQVLTAPPARWHCQSSLVEVGGRHHEHEKAADSQDTEPFPQMLLFAVASSGFIRCLNVLKHV